MPSPSASNFFTRASSSSSVRALVRGELPVAIGVVKGEGRANLLLGGHIPDAQSIELRGAEVVVCKPTQCVERSFNTVNFREEGGGRHLHALHACCQT
eukprot:scaffold41447_cov64-Phaeocystis_antarctica.AAC.6